MIPVLLSAAVLVSCAPMTYTLPIEKRDVSPDNVDFMGTLPGVLTLLHTDSVYADSTLMSAFAIGMAERLEVDLGLDSGSVPVFSMLAFEVDFRDSAARRRLHDMTGVDFLVVADSLYVGDYTVSDKKEMAYVDSRFLYQTVVELPYSVKVRVYRAGTEAPVSDISDSDVFAWSLMADSQIPSLRAVEKVDGSLVEYFNTMGRTVASELSPGWSTVNLVLYVYNNDRWTEACRLAYLFEWEKAMDIWLVEASSPDARKAACAAHNISVACEVLGMDGLAAQWRERSEY